MDPALTQIIVTSITVCVPALVTVITTKSVKKQANKHSTRSDIMQLIIEDHVRINTLVQIAHGDKIGRFTEIVAHASIQGRVTIGENV